MLTGLLGVTFSTPVPAYLTMTKFLAKVVPFKSRWISVEVNSSGIMASVLCSTPTTPFGNALYSNAHLSKITLPQSVNFNKFAFPSADSEGTMLYLNFTFVIVTVFTISKLISPKLVLAKSDLLDGATFRSELSQVTPPVIVSSLVHSKS